MNELYKGIFWITDIDDWNAEQLMFRIPVTSMGEVIEPEKLDLNSKNVDNYNHRLLWESLPNKNTHNKPYNYYPRGRVEIKRGKAVIYANPNICLDELINLLVKRFGLNKENGIMEVALKPDGSNHYKCYLDG
ncbi:MAG: hypothetical protein J6U54_24605 [Clostridiales bacterium]|nr:hypothetical protein [Clostridiales bacterium]